MDEPIFEAELIEDEGKKGYSMRSSNAALGATIAVVLVFLLMSRVIGAPLEEQAIQQQIEESYTAINMRY
ncbi:MAG: hypothetical protein ISR22_07630, partial [Candidatus Poseidoniaceae archaeon]|nr:hypothetical protein [Candidatus Poseidoniaceae archaeon]